MYFELCCFPYMLYAPPNSIHGYALAIDMPLGPVSRNLLSFRLNLVVFEEMIQESNTIHYFSKTPWI